tara:strand:+ start:150 stop:731 length:582 start_codon:yes stop_codon:yes gene_type:complete
MIYKLLDPKHPMVQTKMTPWTETNGSLEDRKEFTKDMVETMRHYGGIGMSSNQVGYASRMFVWGDNNNYIACFNPKITDESETKIPIEEGCLSYPGLFVKIYRPDRISVEFEDEDGVVHTDDLGGIECRVFQHEMDHMDGIDFTKRASKMSLDIAKRKRKRGLLKLKRAHGKDILSRQRLMNPEKSDLASEKT